MDSHVHSAAKRQIFSAFIHTPESDRGDFQEKKRVKINGTKAAIASGKGKRKGRAEPLR
jgi:hypothetical protein